jgi:DNA polymerase-4
MIDRFTARTPVAQSVPHPYWPKKSLDRIIFHVDMNTFYASVEQCEHPELRGKPIVVGGSEERRHGIVLTKSQEAKKYGIKTAEALWQARQKCPELIVVPPNYRVYQRYSRMARSICYQYTDRVEPFGIDENWLDLTGTVQLHGGNPLRIAAEISERMKAELGVTVSIGIGWDKITAKFGSEYQKPDAITSVTRENYRDLFWGAPVGELLYVGRATERKLHAAGILTIGELAQTSDAYLQNVFGKIGFALRAFARGEDITPVKQFSIEESDVCRMTKSYGNGLTAPHDIVTVKDAKALVYLLTESVAQRLREGGARARTVTIAARDGDDLTSYSRQTTLSRPTAITSVIAKAAWELLVANQKIDEDHPMRGIWVRASGLSPASGAYQLSLLENDRLEDLDHAIDDLRRRFGNRCVRRGAEFMDPALHGLDIKGDHTIHPVGYFYG